MVYDDVIGNKKTKIKITTVIFGFITMKLKKFEIPVEYVGAAKSMESAFKDSLGLLGFG